MTTRDPTTIRHDAVQYDRCFADMMARSKVGGLRASAVVPELREHVQAQRDEAADRRRRPKSA